MYSLPLKQSMSTISQRSFKKLFGEPGAACHILPCQAHHAELTTFCCNCMTWIDMVGTTKDNQVVTCCDQMFIAKCEMNEMKCKHWPAQRHVVARNVYETEVNLGSAPPRFGSTSTERRSHKIWNAQAGTAHTRQHGMFHVAKKKPSSKVYEVYVSLRISSH